MGPEQIATLRELLSTLERDHAWRLADTTEDLTGVSEEEIRAIDAGSAREIEALRAAIDLAERVNRRVAAFEIDDEQHAAVFGGRDE